MISLLVVSLEPFTYKDRFFFEMSHIFSKKAKKLRTRLHTEYISEMPIENRIKENVKETIFSSKNKSNLKW